MIRILRALSNCVVSCPVPSWSAEVGNGTARRTIGTALAALVLLASGTVAQAQSNDWIVNLADTGFDPIAAG